MIDIATGTDIMTPAVITDMTIDTITTTIVAMTDGIITINIDTMTGIVITDIKRKQCIIGIFTTQ